MTLKGVIALILRYFAEFGSFRAHYVKVVEDTPVVQFLARRISGGSRERGRTFPVKCRNIFL